MDIQSGSPLGAAMTFKTNGAIDWNQRTIINTRMDPASGTGSGIQIWDSDYSNKYQIGSGNISGADRTAFLPVMTVDGDFEITNASQTVTNKTMLANSNTFSGIAQDPIVKRTGRAQPITPAAAASAINIMTLVGGLNAHTGTGAGTNTITWDTTEGLVAGYVSGAVSGQNIGLVSPTTVGGIARRAFATRVRLRSKVDTVAGSVSRFYFGFTSATALPITDTPLATTDHGIIVGFKSTDTNYTIYSNDGATSVTSTAVTGPIAKDTNYHTIEISWTASGNIIVTFDGTAQTISTDLPGTTTNLYLNVVAQTATAAARTHSVKGLWFETTG